MLSARAASLPLNHQRPKPSCHSGAGCVLIDDRPVGEYSRKWLKQRVALVSQEPVLYARSIRRWGAGALRQRGRPSSAAGLLGCLLPSRCQPAGSTLEAAAAAGTHTLSILLPPPPTRNIIYGLEEEDGVPPEEVPTQADVEQAAR